jgi:hypothetical protein
VDGILFHPERVKAKVEGCQVSEPGTYEVELGSAIELSYAYPIDPKTTPDKVACEAADKDVLKPSDLGIRRIEQWRGTVGTSRVMFFFKTLKTGHASVTLSIDGQKYAYTFNVK